MAVYNGIIHLEGRQTMLRHIPMLLLGLLGIATIGLSQTSSTTSSPPAQPVRVIKAHLGELPGLINADKTGPFVDLVAGVVREETGLDPVLSTSGGTSDARFVKDHCPVLEFGLVGHFMHQVDERVPADQVRQLARIYRRILERYFA